MLTALACDKTELRGKSKRSEDGRTYLVVAESPGCTTFHVDGKPWFHALHAKGPIAPGLHRIACADDTAEVQFEVEKGTTFRFDYWGP